MGCSCLVSDCMLIQGTNRCEIPELCVCWENSCRRPWDSGKGRCKSCPAGWSREISPISHSCSLPASPLPEEQLSSSDGFCKDWPAGVLGCSHSSACSSSALLPPPPHPPRPFQLLTILPPHKSKPVRGSPGLQTSCDAKQSPSCSCSWALQGHFFINLIPLRSAVLRNSGLIPTLISTI